MHLKLRKAAGEESRKMIQLPHQASMEKVTLVFLVDMHTFELFRRIRKN